MTFLARNRRKTVAYVGDMEDLDTLDLPQGDETTPNPEQELIALEDSERLRQAIAGLPAPFLETLVMRDINGLSYRAIAEATEMPVGTVMSRLARARAMLAKTLRAGS
jgi:RNA polymerase sigma-70 factor (ECF subfamily)